MALGLGPVPGGRRHRAALALRLAWRDIRAHRGRSALVMALIALPIAAFSGAATLAQSMLPTPAEAVVRALGQTQARLGDMHSSNAHGLQNVAGDAFTSTDHTPDPDFVATRPVDAVPAGYRALPYARFQTTATAGRAQVPLAAVAADVLDPAFDGRMALLSGRGPAASSEALASPGVLERFRKELGNELATAAGTFVLVGTVRDLQTADSGSVLYLAADQLPAAGAATVDTDVYLVGPAPVEWAQVRGFNARGIDVTSRHVLLDPPADTELGAAAGLGTGGYSSYRAQTYLSFGALAGVLALLEVVLLAGAAFAVGARKQHRDLALLAASGAESATLRAVVTSSGVWLGAAGGAVGAAVGLAAASGVVLLAAGRAAFAGLHPQWPAALALVLVGAGAGYLAALVPARAVAKAAAAGALAAGRGAHRPARWPARLGLALVAAAAVALAASAAAALATRQTGAAEEWVVPSNVLAVGGAACLVLGLVLLASRIIAFATARTGWLPVPLRLAARDAARNNTRTPPAVAAVLAAATLASALMVGAASAGEQSSQDYAWAYNPNQTALPLQPMVRGPGPGQNYDVKELDPAAVAGLLRRELGTGTGTLVLRAAATPHCLGGEDNREGIGTTPDCTAYMLQTPAGNRCVQAPDGKPADLADWRCTGSLGAGRPGSQIPPIVVGGAPELAALLGRAPGEAALAMLARGGMVATNKTFLAETGAGTATLISYDIRQPLVQGPARTFMPEWEPQTTRVLDALVEEPGKALPFYGVISPATAAAAGMDVADVALLVEVDKAPPAALNDQVSSALAEFYGPYLSFRVETGGDSAGVAVTLWLAVAAGALVTLSAAGITAGLALADGRADHAVLAGVGAGPGLRKSLSAAQTLLTAWLGTVLGIGAGALPTAVVLLQQRGMPIVLPWLQLGALALAVPLVGAGAAWLLTRGKMPLPRRGTLA
ncbi:hypothetical protein ACQCSX_16615 [Pseudarthrobacter sp. P1]|uniref:hypothetical protein n=1 Tax=Pseudarthrobacter sp. P1 TaxID=3418418 RepID=UPI003CF2C5B3